ncbi:MAG: N-6 DNA methylase, partial [Candidatus Hodarchaeales archaeon]
MSQSQKSKGQYFTPSNIVQTIVKMTLNYIDKQNTPLRVLDPATGEGIFSQEVIKLFRHNFDLIHVNALD